MISYLSYADADFGILGRPRLHAIHKDVGDDLEYFSGAAVNDCAIRKNFSKPHRFGGQRLQMNTKRSFCDVDEIKSLGLGFVAVEREGLPCNLAQASELSLYHLHIQTDLWSRIRQVPGQEHKISDGLQGIVHLVHNNAGVSPCNGKPLALLQRLLE
jgi:hypothetical protein